MAVWREIKERAPIVWKSGNLFVQHRQVVVISLSPRSHILLKGKSWSYTPIIGSQAWTESNKTCRRAHSELHCRSDWISLHPSSLMWRRVYTFLEVKILYFSLHYSLCLAYNKKITGIAILENWKSLTKISMQLSYHPAITLWAFVPEKWKLICTKNVQAVLFITVKSRKWSKCQ